MIDVTLERVLLCSEQVKNQTEGVHAATEKLLIPILKHIGSLEAYAAVLSLFYGFFAPVENKIEPYMGETGLNDFAARRHADRILKDLQYIPHEKEIAICTDLPLITNGLQALGALYVLEGSTLGGVHIARMLQSNKAIMLPEEALLFFKGYGKDTESMWLKFKQILNTTVTTEAAIYVVTEAAIDTFEKFKCWIQTNL